MNPNTSSFIAPGVEGRCRWETRLPTKAVSVTAAAGLVAHPPPTSTALPGSVSRNHRLHSREGRMPYCLHSPDEKNKSLEKFGNLSKFTRLISGGRTGPNPGLLVLVQYRRAQAWDLL